MVSAIVPAETAENDHPVQPLAGGRWLLVRGRAGGERDCGAHIYKVNGTPLRLFHPGDGIEDVQATAQGNIWVSHFEEGVVRA